MTNLIHRLEAAEGPSRELDRAIHEAVFSHDTTDGPEGDPVFKEPNSPLWLNVPAYTASLDAAVSLVPVVHGYRIDFCPTSEAQAVVGGLRAAGKTPDLALCAAALKARNPD